MIDLSDYTFETLLQGPEFILRRARAHDLRASRLTVEPIALHGESSAHQQLLDEHEFRANLDAEWALCPLEIVHRGTQVVLVLDDPGGYPLRNALAETLDVVRAINISIAIAEALQGAHERGIVHRNVKPENLIVCDDGRIRLTGFGLAIHSASNTASSGSSGFIVGTLSHMAPEQTGRTNQPADPRSDLYAVGIVLYQMLTGELPFDASEPIEWIHCHLAHQHLSPSRRNTECPAAFDDLVAKLLAKAPEDRYQSAAALAGDLRHLLAALTAGGGIEFIQENSSAGPFRSFANDRSDGRAEMRTALAPALDGAARGESSRLASAGVSLHEEIDRVDMRAMLNAARELSIAIEPHALVQSLMHIAMKHAGAVRGVLVLLHDQVPRIAASAEVLEGRIEVLQGENSRGGFGPPESALRETLRTGKTVLIDSASSAPHATSQRKRTAICVAVSKQARIVGALYLENNLVNQSFSRELISVLEVLGAQAAVSLENANLYTDLKRSEAFLAEGQRLSKTGSWSRDIRTGRLAWSEQIYRIFGLDPQRTEAPSFEEFAAMVHPEDRAEWRKAVDRGVDDGSIIAHEFRVVAATGVVKHIYTIGRPVADENGRIREVIGTTMDISDRKRREDELREAQSELALATRMTTMGELAASIAHEMNQPLSAIVTNAETVLLLLSKGAPDIRAAISASERIVRDGKHAAGVINSIRSMLRKSQPETELLDIDAVIRDVLAIVRGELKKHEIALQIDLSAAPFKVNGNAILLKQVIVNLIKNSIEAMAIQDDSRRTLSIRTSREVDGVVWVAVEDSGVGLDDVAMSRMFEPFYTTKPQGMGMGLSICRSIVELHGGEVRVSCGLSQGTSIRFSLPPNGVA